MSHCSTPVVLCVFNRPEKVRRLMQVLAAVRPATLLIVADGPRLDHPEDVQLCRRVRTLLERVEWPCNVLRNYSDKNQGADTRVPAGIDWAFQHVEEMIMLEDDLLPHPSFFRWTTEMLDRYRGNDQILCVSGRNEMGRWMEREDDHHLIYRGSNFACATWRNAWRRARAVALPGADTAVSGLLNEGRIDPWVARHFEWLCGLSRLGIEHGWDTRWELQRALLGGLSVVPAVNLVAHAGFDAEATHAKTPDNLRALQPVDCARGLNTGIKRTPDHRLDRWSLFIALMETCRNPRMVRRLARSHIQVADERVRYHLGPFSEEADSLDALRHLRSLGTKSTRLDGLIAALEEPF
jgi:hypothetical protein